MKTETTSDARENSETKQAWTEPVLTIMAVELETCAMPGTGGDGMAMGGTDLT